MYVLTICLLDDHEHAIASPVFAQHLPGPRTPGHLEVTTRPHSCVHCFNTHHKNKTCISVTILSGRGFRVHTLNPN